jgi:hypothetical protein
VCFQPNGETNRFRNIVRWTKIFCFPVCVLTPLSHRSAHCCGNHHPLSHMAAGKY